MALALLLIVIMGGSLLAVQHGLLRSLGGPLDLDSFLFGVSLISSIGFIIFRMRVWGGNTRTFFMARPASLQPGPSGCQLFLNALISSAAIAGVLITVVVVVLEYYRRHDVVVQVLDWILNKMGKIINVLLH